MKKNSNQRGSAIITLLIVIIIILLVLSVSFGMLFYKANSEKLNKNAESSTSNMVEVPTTQNENKQTNTIESEQTYSQSNSQRQTKVFIKKLEEGSFKESNAGYPYIILANNTMYFSSSNRIEEKKYSATYNIDGNGKIDFRLKEENYGENLTFFDANFRMEQIDNEEEWIIVEDGDDGGKIYYILDTSEEENKVDVIEGIHYELESEKRKISVPQIINGGENAIKLNQEIASKTLALTYNMMNYDSEKIGATTSYQYFTLNNVIVIVTNTTYTQWPASGNGVFNLNFIYDIQNDKILKMSEALKLLGYTKEDINNAGAKSYEEFDLTESNDSGAPVAVRSYFTIENNKLKLNFKMREE